jgi:hypothetical protein
MQIGAALAGWLNSPERQAETAEAIESFGVRWSQNPDVAELGRQVDAMEPRTAAGLVHAVRKFLGQPEAIRQMVDEAVACGRQDPFFRPPLRLISSDIHSGVVLFHHRDLILTLGTVPIDAIAATKTAFRGATSVYFSGQWTVLHFVKAGGATLSFWETNPIGPDFVASECGPCRMVGRRRVEDGETIVFDGRSQSFVFDHAEADMVIIQGLIGPEAGPLTVGFDSRTLSFAGASSSSEESSRTQMLVSLLRLMERADAVPLFRASLASPHFYTRWHIMREFLALDAEAALPSLREMAEGDPHPEIRAVAAQTLEMLLGEEEDAPCPA